MDRGSFARGGALLLGLATTGLRAQSPALPASDPVGIARGGAGVAYGRSLEAASLNPALLVTLEDRRAAYLAMGMDQESTQLTLQSNQRTLFSSDRNRGLPAFGAGWRAGDRMAFGLVLDTPFARHLRLPLESTTRFLGDRIDLRAERLQFQAAYKVSDRFSLGAGLGVARLTYGYGSTFRAPVALDPTQPVSTANPSQGLVETGIYEHGRGTSPAVSLGFRFAMNPRWTVGGTFQGPMKGSISMTAALDGRAPAVYANDGYGAPPLGLAAAATTLLARAGAQAGTGDLQLPWKATVGVRQRVNQLFTWEADLRLIGTSQYRTPEAARLTVPGAVQAAPVVSPESRGGSGLSVMGELALGKRWTARAGASLEQGWRSEGTVTPLLGGSKTAAFSAGFGFRALGGELTGGYQFRQSRDIDSPALDGAWSRLGYHTTGATTRVEGMGHLWSLGFRRSF